jgi:hypothetical protein
MLAMQEVTEAQVELLKVEAGVRYWEDATVNGVSDDDGTLIPFRSGDCWCPTINLDSGTILEWPEGVEASIHYKVCDAGTYTLLDDSGADVRTINGYVPSILSPGGSGYGDYIIMKVDGAGKIENWRVDLEPFEDED